MGKFVKLSISEKNVCMDFLSESMEKIQRKMFKGNPSDKFLKQSLMEFLQKTLEEFLKQSIAELPKQTLKNV